MVASPLLLSNRPERLSAEALDLLTNPRLLVIHNNPLVQAATFIPTDNVSILACHHHHQIKAAKKQKKKSSKKNEGVKKKEEEEEGRRRVSFFLFLLFFFLLVLFVVLFLFSLFPFLVLVLLLACSQCKCSKQADLFFKF